MKSKTIIFFGRSGAGKGTQAKLLEEYIQNNDLEKKRVLYIETGERFRDFIKNQDNYTSNLTANVVNTGGLMPEFMPIWVWTSYLIDNYTGSEHMILDGLSRRYDEAPILDSALRFYRRENKKIVFINTSRDWSIEKLTARGRKDDNEADIQKRLDWFDENTMPAINYFKGHVNYEFFEIKGEQPIEKVHADILSKIFSPEEVNRDE